jgi:hypothetical protein
VSTPWPLVGAIYGALLWAAGVAPALGSLVLRSGRHRAALVALAVEGIVACVAVGELCAYVWQRQT